MSFFGKVKKQFSSGGIGIDVDCPPTFRWNDDVLPVRVRLRNKSKESRTVTSLSMSLGEDPSQSAKPDEADSQREQRERRIEESATRYEYSEPVVLGPEEERILEIDFPLSLAGAAGAAGAEEQPPGWVSKASKAMSFLGEVNRQQKEFIVRVGTSTEGFNASKVATAPLRNLGIGESETRIGRNKPKF